MTIELGDVLLIPVTQFVQTLIKTAE
jgi:hypothetical protein